MSNSKGISRYRPPWGWVLLFVGGALVLTGMVGRGHITSESQRALQVTIGDLTRIVETQSQNINEQKQRIEDLLVILYRERSIRVMEMPRTREPRPLPSASPQLQLASPPPMALVPWRQFVGGVVADPRAVVWLIVHPVNSGSYWVQPKVTMTVDGTWQVFAFFGNPGGQDVGKAFELVAVADPEDRLEEADILEDWPAARWVSDVVTVVRK